MWDAVCGVYHEYQLVPFPMVFYGLSANLALAWTTSHVQVVPTKSLQAIEMTSASYDRINPNRVGLIDESTEDIDHFLGKFIFDII